MRFSDAGASRQITVGNGGRANGPALVAQGRCSVALRHWRRACRYAQLRMQWQFMLGEGHGATPGHSRARGSSHVFAPPLPSPSGPGRTAFLVSGMTSWIHGRPVWRRPRSRATCRTVDLEVPALALGRVRQRPSPDACRRAALCVGDARQHAGGSLRVQRIGPGRGARAGMLSGTSTSRLPRLTSL